MREKREGPAAPGYADEVAYGTSVIAFDVVRARRETIGIHVYPSGRVEVRIPQDAAPEDVRSRVRRRARWILRHRRRFAELVQEVPEKEYVSGETHLYLGRQYRLKVLPLPGEADASDGERVQLKGRYLEVVSSCPHDAAHTRSLLETWYRDRAERHLRVRFRKGCALMARYDVEEPPLMIRSMQQRWGSCTPAGRLILNPRLVLAPTACIDYVVIHELCHLKHPHHGRAFVELLSRVLPDWEERKHRLERVQ